MSNLIIFIGMILILFGLIFKFFEVGIKSPVFPGDILIKKENFVFYFPIMTSLIISLIITILLWIIFKK